MTCRTGKIAYATATAAHKALGGLTKVKSRSDKSSTAGWHKGPTKAYRCPMCGQWHIGHQAKTESRAKA